MREKSHKDHITAHHPNVIWDNDAIYLLYDEFTAITHDHNNYWCQVRHTQRPLLWSLLIIDIIIGSLYIDK